MKRRIISLFVLLTVTLTGWAQATDRISGILHESGKKPRIFYGADALKEAVAAAPAIDPSDIYLTAGTFNATEITKPVKIYGAGWVEQLSMKNNDTPVENSILPTVINGHLPITMSEDKNKLITVHNFIIEGVRINGVLTLAADINWVEVRKCYLAGNIGIDGSNYYSLNQQNVHFMQCYIGGAIFAPYQTTFYNCYIGGGARIRHTDREGGWLRFNHCILNNSFSSTSQFHDDFECTNSIVNLRSFTNKQMFNYCDLSVSSGVVGGTGNNYSQDFTQYFKDASNLDYSDDRTFEPQSTIVHYGNDAQIVGITGGQYAWDKLPQTNRARDVQIGSSFPYNLVISYGPTSQPVTAYYWIDGDISNQKRYYTDSPNVVTGAGPHWIGFRTTPTAGGLWSNHVERLVYFLNLNIDKAGRIVDSEYWIDGVRKATNGTAGSQMLDITSLSPGLHQLTVRVKDNLGVWSNQVARTFFIAPPAWGASATSIASREFWIDDDIAHRQVIGTEPAVIDITGLSTGLHTLTMRVQDDLGLWSSQMTRQFFVAPAAPLATATSITSREFWIDDITHRQVIGTEPAVIDITDLSPGLHTLTMRVQDNLGLWSSQMTRQFFVAPVSAAKATLSKYIYWIDDDREHSVIGNATEENGQIVIDLSSLPKGEHKLTLGFVDSKGAASQLVVQTFKFLVKGDANGDGMVNTVDLVATANYIMENPSADFNVSAADVNEDSQITVADLVMMLNIIVGNTNAQ